MIFFSNAIAPTFFPSHKRPRKSSTVEKMRAINRNRSFYYFSIASYYKVSIAPRSMDSYFFHSTRNPKSDPSSKEKGVGMKAEVVDPETPKAKGKTLIPKLQRQRTAQGEENVLLNASRTRHETKEQLQVGRHGFPGDSLRMQCVIEIIIRNRSLVVVP